MNRHSDVSFADLVTDNKLNKDMITIFNYIERTLNLITGRDSTLSVCTLIMIALYVYGDMPTQRIAKVLHLSTAAVASKASRLKKEGKVTKHGIYFHLTDESRAEVERLDNTIKANFKKLDQEEAVLLYNSFLMMLMPFTPIEERPSLLCLVCLMTVSFDQMCKAVFGGKAKLYRISYLYYSEIFKKMNYVKYTALLPKSIQNIQRQCLNLAEGGYIRIDQQMARQQLPNISLTKKGHESLITSLTKSNKRTAVMMLHMNKPEKEYFIKSCDGIVKIATNAMRSQAMKVML